MGGSESRDAASRASSVGSSRGLQSRQSSSKWSPSSSIGAWDAIFVVDSGNRFFEDDETSDNDNEIESAETHGSFLAEACVQELRRMRPSCHISVAPRSSSGCRAHAFSGGLRSATAWLRDSCEDRSAARMKRVLVIGAETATTWSSATSVLPLLRADPNELPSALGPAATGSATATGRLAANGHASSKQHNEDSSGDVHGPETGSIVTIAELLADVVGSMQPRPGLWLCPCDGMILARLPAKVPSAKDAFALVTNVLRPQEARRRFRVAFDPVNNTVESLIRPENGPDDTGDGACLLFYMNFELCEEIVALAERVGGEESLDVISDALEVLTENCTSDSYMTMRGSKVSALIKEEVFKALHGKFTFVAVPTSEDSVVVSWPQNPEELLELHNDTPDDLLEALEDFGFEFTDNSDIVESVAGVAASRQVRGDSADSISSGLFNGASGGGIPRVHSRSGSMHDNAHVFLKPGTKVLNSLLVGQGSAEAGSLIENSRLSGRWSIGTSSIVTDLQRTALRRNLHVGDGVFLQEVVLNSGGHVLVVYGIQDEMEKPFFMGKPMDQLLRMLNCDPTSLGLSSASASINLQDMPLYPLRASSRDELHLAQFYLLQVLAQRIMQVSPLLHYRARSAWWASERVSLRYVQTNYDPLRQSRERHALATRIQAFLIVATLLEHGRAGVDRSLGRIRKLLSQGNDLDALLNVLDGVAANARSKAVVAAAALGCIAASLRQRHAYACAKSSQKDANVHSSSVNLTAIFAPALEKMGSARAEAVQQAARLRKSLSHSATDEEVAVQYDALARAASVKRSHSRNSSC